MRVMNGQTQFIFNARLTVKMVAKQTVCGKCFLISCLTLVDHNTLSMELICKLPS